MNHIVTISDYWETDTEKGVHYHDDKEQKGDDGGKGDGGKPKKALVTEEDGKYYFASDNRQIYAAVSESVPEPASVAALCTGLVAFAGFAMRRRK